MRRRHSPPHPSAALFLALGLTLATAASAPAQMPTSEAKAAPRHGFHDEVAVEWISVPVSVAPRPGENLSSARKRPLPARRFTLRVDGEEVPIEHFDDRLEAPVAVLLLVDASGSMAIGRRLEAAFETLGCLVDGLGDGDHAALAAFGGDGLDLLASFEAGNRNLLTALSSLEPYGTTALLDALAVAPGLARGAPTPRRSLILVTDGEDNSSTIPPQRLRSLLGSAGLPLTVVEIDQVPMSALEPPVPGGFDPRQPLSLAALAAVTGGSALRIDSGQQEVSRSSAEACRRVLRQLRRRYLLGFTTAAGSEPSFHRIEVSISGERRAIRHRTSYFGAPPTPLARSARPSSGSSTSSPLPSPLLGPSSPSNQERP